MFNTIIRQLKDIRTKTLVIIHFPLHSTSFNHQPSVKINTGALFLNRQSNRNKLGVHSNGGIRKSTATVEKKSQNRQNVLTVKADRK